MTQTLMQGEGTSASSRMFWPASWEPVVLLGKRVFRFKRPCDSRGGGPAEKIGNELPGDAQPRHVHTGLDAQPVEQIEYVFAGDVARRTLGIRTAAESGDGAVERRDPELQRGVNVRQRQTVGIVKMSRLFGDRHCVGDSRYELLGLAGRAGADRVSERNLVTPHRLESARDVADAPGSDLAFIRTAEHAGDVTANANAVRLSRGEHRLRPFEAFRD